MAGDVTPESRELNLVGKVEMRIALAESDQKLQPLLTTYLVPLLLKLASEHAAVRNKVIAVCQHVGKRLASSTTISLPVQPLLKQFRESDNSLVKHFDLVYIQQGLARLSARESIELCPSILHLSLAAPDVLNPPTLLPDAQPSINQKLWQVAFEFLIQLLPSWKLAERGSQEEQSLCETFDMSKEETDMLAFELSRFLQYEGRVSPAATHRLNFAKFPRTTLSQLKKSVASFLFTALFTDSQRFIPAIVLSADSTNLDAFRIGDTMFKQCTFDLEILENVNGLYRLFAETEDGGPQRAKVKMRVLALLSKSNLATTYTENILRMIKEQLFSGDQSLAPGLEATKLRAAIFTFLNWVIRVGDDQHLRAIAAEAQLSLKEFIESQGWPSPDMTGTKLSAAEVDLRSKAYESIGTLATKMDPDIAVVKWLFTSLRCDLSDAHMHVSIEEALGRLLNMLAAKSIDTSAELKAMLLWNMTAEVGDDDPEYGYKTKRSARFASVRYANRCLPFYDVDARWIDLLAISKPGGRQELLEEGAKGLDPYWYEMANLAVGSTITKKSPDLVFPDFVSLVHRIIGEDDDAEVGSEPNADLVQMLAPAVSLCRNVLATEAMRDTELALDIQPDWERRIDALLSANNKARKLLKGYLRQIRQKSVVRMIQSALLGMSLNLGRCGDLALELCGLVSNDVLSALSDSTFALVQRAATSNNLNTQGQAARVFGILFSLPQKVDNTLLLKSLVETCNGWKEAVGQDLNRIRGSLLCSAFLATRLVFRRDSLGLQEHIDSISLISANILEASRDLALREAAATSVGQLSLWLPQAKQFPWDSEVLVESLTKDAKKENEVSVSALGRLTWSHACIGQDVMARKALERLYDLQEIRRPELHFAVGEALAVAAAGWQSSSTTEEFDIDAELPSRAVKGTLLGEVLEKVITDCKTTKPSLKKAAVIWLLCLIQYTGVQDEVKQRLRKCQVAFGRLLSDRDEVVQESASRGLGVVYEMGDKGLREDLVRDLVQSFTSSDTAKVMGGSVNEDTELFDAGALPTGEGSVTTYKDIVSLANEMGDPSLIYRFMNLASNNAIWTSRSAFGRFGLGNVLADSSYLTENKRFYPKLYRYRFDPNPNVQRSMNDIWKALVKDSNAVIESNFDLIMDDLLKSILGKEWRVREASCAAIADLVQGREVEKYEKYLNDIWNVAFKVMDDIKETVRLAAMTLCRTLTSLLIRNLEVGEGTTIRAKKMLEHAMPFLLRQLESGAAKEILEYAIVTLLQVVKKAPSKALRPFAPIVLEKLVNSLSSLEHESINYLHLNAEKYGLTAEKLDKMRVSSMSSSPVTEAIDRCLESLDSTSGEPAAYLEDAMGKLADTFKTAIGLPSKVGLSRVLVTLTLRHSVIFRPYADRFVQLVRKNMLDRNETVSVAFSMSLAYLMRLASDKQVEETISFAKNLYFVSEESSNRVVAAEIVNAVAKVSNDVFMHFAALFLPFAFIGRHDNDENVKARLSETWKENVGGSGAVVLYRTEIIELVTKNIQSPRWAVKHACCLAIADLATSLESQGPYTMLQAISVWPMMEAALAGKTWAGKEKVIAAFPKYAKGAKCIWDDVQISKQMSTIALREAQRNNVAYRSFALTALGEYAEARTDLDLTVDIVPLVRGIVDEVVTDEADKMDIDSKDASSKRASEDLTAKTISAAVRCVFQTLSPKTESVPTLEHATSTIDMARSLDSRSVRSSLYEAAKTFIERFPSRKSLEANINGSEKAVEGVSEEAAVFSTKVILEILTDRLGGGDPENLRIKRGALAVSIAGSRYGV